MPISYYSTSLTSGDTLLDDIYTLMLRADWTPVWHIRQAFEKSGSSKKKTITMSSCGKDNREFIFVIITYDSEENRLDVSVASDWNKIENKSDTQTSDAYLTIPSSFTYYAFANNKRLVLYVVSNNDYYGVYAGQLERITTESDCAYPVVVMHIGKDVTNSVGEANPNGKGKIVQGDDATLDELCYIITPSGLASNYSNPNSWNSKDYLWPIGVGDHATSPAAFHGYLANVFYTYNGSVFTPASGHEILTKDFVAFPSSGDGASNTDQLLVQK